jgi:hypothetical protein
VIKIIYRPRGKEKLIPDFPDLDPKIMYAAGLVSLSSNQGEGPPKYIPLLVLLGSSAVLYGVTRYLRSRHPSYRRDKSDSMDYSNCPETKSKFRNDILDGVEIIEEVRARRRRENLEKFG